MLKNRKKGLMLANLNNKCDKKNGSILNRQQWFDARSNKKTKSFGKF